MISLNHNLDTLTRSGIRRYTALANTVPGCVKLTIGEPEFSTPEPIKQAAMQALKENQTHYAPNQGLAALRQAIAAFETGRGFSCGADQVIVTVGACQALFTALMGILNPGDEVIVPTPAFSLYETIATAAGAKVVALDLSKTGFQIEELPITSKTKAIVLNSPHNPTGVIFSNQSLAAVKKAVLGKPIYVVWDGVYAGLSNAPDLSVDGELADQLLFCQSFSKPYSMTGWRVGYLIGPKAVMERLLLLHAAQVTAVPTFLQTACITALEQDVTPMAQVYDRRRALVCRRLTEMGLEYPAPEGAFYAFARIAPFGMSAEAFCTRMIQQAGVATVPGSCFGMDGYLRLSYCCADSELVQGLERMEQFIKSLK